MNDIIEIHEEVLTYLLGVREYQPDLRFSLRRTNREGRLEDGYWFYGNEYYVAISFWSGNDWKNRTPNIIFVILENGQTYLEVNVSDSPVKREFAERFMVPGLNLYSDGKRYRKSYSWGADYMSSLMDFVGDEKPSIDKLLVINKDFFESRGLDDKIGFIPEVEFERALEKTLSFRDKVSRNPLTQENKGLENIEIRGFGAIKFASIRGIPEDNQWIFLTGENGTGKTTVLKAIATFLSMEQWNPGDINGHFDTMIRACLYTDNSEMVSGEISPLDGPGPMGILLASGFAAYGASRLTNLSGTKGVVSQYKKRSKPLYNLSHTDGILFDLLTKYRQWSRSKDKGKLKERFDNIKEALLELIPNLNNIIFELDQSPQKVWYVEEDENELPFARVEYHQLASGIRSMVAMFGDMMCRLFDQQPQKTDPSELTGIVLIDEIDLHLHPKLQKMLVEQLSKTFQKIQFIVTTHSPIPLLGASERSRFFKVTRNKEEDVQIVDLSDINVLEMLPNAILTSELFNMEGLFSRSAVSPDKVRTEDNYKDIVINDKVRAGLKEIAEQIRKSDESGQ
jgi:AAA15 family ATPase/GTPase